MRVVYSVLMLLVTLASTTCSSVAAIKYPPALPAPQTGSDVVAVRLQNSGVARYVTFGQAFKRGDVPAGASLVAKIGGTTVPVQVDVKTAYPDGSVRFAAVTILAPGSGDTDAILALGGSSGAPLSLPVALASHNLTVTLSGGTAATIDATQALTSAIAAGQARYWLNGPLAAQARVDVPVVGALHVIFDLTVYADGTVTTDATFANDYAMGSVGGTRSYTATIRRNGQAVYTSPALTHYQYQQWRWTDGSGAVNVQRDVPYLLATGVLPNYDLATGIETTAIGTATYAPLGAAGIDKPDYP